MAGLDGRIHGGAAHGLDADESEAFGSGTVLLLDRMDVERALGQLGAQFAKSL